jgi:adenine deaminase
MATLNAAEAFGMSDRGAVGPGRLADLIVFDDIRRPEVRLTVVGGQVVARDGALVIPLPAAGARRLGAVRIDWGAVDLRIPASAERVRTIGIIPGQLITECRILPVCVANGEAVADPGTDTAKIAVIERHRGSGRVGLGFVQGLGLREGAIAGTVAHDHHNLIVAGADDESMFTAARAVADAGGGLAVAVGTETHALLGLPIAGLMSDRTVHEAADSLRTIVEAAHSLGSTLHDPFMTLSFLGLEVIPSLKLTDLGLVDVDRFALVPLFV